MLSNCGCLVSTQGEYLCIVFPTLPICVQKCLGTLFCCLLRGGFRLFQPGFSFLLKNYILVPELESFKFPMSAVYPAQSEQCQQETTRSGVMKMGTQHHWVQQWTSGQLCAPTEAELTCLHTKAQKTGRGRNSTCFDAWRLYIMKTFPKEGKYKVFQNVSPKEKQIDV